jgi:hypothetical protein
MKQILLACLLLGSLSSMGQEQKKSAAITDPKLGEIVLRDMSGLRLDPEALVMDQVVRLIVPVGNMGNSIPAGTAKIKIGFGSRIKLDPTFNMNLAGLNHFITWTSSVANGQLELTGELTGEIPMDFEEFDVFFKVKGVMPGRSTITANFLVTNHTGTAVLSDMNPANNVSYLSYAVTAKAAVPPIKIKQIARGACTVNLVFAPEGAEVNISRYDIEVSKDGVSYVKVSEMAAAGQGSYRTSFALTAAIESPTVTVRIRSVDMDGNYRYSAPVQVAGQCDRVQPWVLNVYPNPATDVRSVVISATEGTFKGKYKVTMMDVTGLRIKTTELQLDNINNFRFNIGAVAAGQYLIQVINTDGSQSGTLKFEKL